MNNITIKKHLRKKLEEFIKNFYKENHKELYDNLIIAGGSIASLINNKPVNDYDIFCKNENAIEIIRNKYVFNEIIRKFDYENTQEKQYLYLFNDKFDKNNNRLQTICFTDNAITFNNKFQVITRFIGEPIEIIKRFDFAHTQSFYDYKENKLYIKNDVYKSLATNKLIYVGEKYPVSSVLRLRKFLKRGWSIDAGYLIKMLFQISLLDLSNRETFIEQLIGIDILYINDFLNRIQNNERIELSYLSNIVNEIYDTIDENM